MTEKLREQVSALVDNELPNDEYELLAYRFAAEKHLCISWTHYHLIGEIMHKALPQVDTRGFTDRIMMALTQEAVAKERSNPFGFFCKTAAGVAVAICVSVVAIVGLRRDSTRMQSLSAPSEVVPQATFTQINPVAYGSASNADWNGNAPDVQAELNNYIINHNEIAAALGQQGMMPYSYIAAYTAQEQARKLQRIPQQPERRDKP